MPKTSSPQPIFREEVKLGHVLLYAATLAFAAAAPALSHARGVHDAYVAALNAGAALFWAIVAAAAHEASHAVAAHAVGLCVVYLSVGRGPALFRRAAGGVQFVARAVPLTGCTVVVAPTLAWLRTRLFVTYAAGPLANVGMLAVAAELGRAERPELHFAPWSACVVVNAIAAAANLFPFPARRGNLATDGWHLLEVPRRSTRELTRLVTAYLCWGAGRCIARGQLAEAENLIATALRAEPDSVVARVVQADLLVLGRRWSEAVPRLRPLVAELEHEPVVGILLNNLAWSLLNLDDDNAMREADILSAQAIEHCPRHPAVNGTRGAVLLCAGKLDEAASHLTFAFDQNTPENKAINACYLAMLHARKGAGAEARDWLERARSIAPTCYVLERAERVVAGVGS
jgi:hypothetical protein